MSDHRVPRAAAAINLIAFLVGIACIVLWILEVDTVLRLYLTVALFAFGPGSGLVQFLKIKDGALQVGLIFAISAAFDLVMAQILLSLGTINGLAAAIILTAATCIRPVHRRARKNALRTETLEGVEA